LQNYKIIFYFLITWTGTSAPRGKSCTISNCPVAKPMPYHKKCGVRDLFQTIFFL